VILEDNFKSREQKDSIIMDRNPGKGFDSKFSEWSSDFYPESRGRQNKMIPEKPSNPDQPVYPILSSRQILATSLPPKNFAVSRQRSTSRETLLKSRETSSSRKFLNLIHDGSKFCLAPGDVTGFSNEFGNYDSLF
jgi:hypothetical protein